MRKHRFFAHSFMKTVSIPLKFFQIIGTDNSSVLKIFQKIENGWRFLDSENCKEPEPMILWKFKLPPNTGIYYVQIRSNIYL